jgi:hypothetical protein
MQLVLGVLIRCLQQDENTEHRAASCQVFASGHDADEARICCADHLELVVDSSLLPLLSGCLQQDANTEQQLVSSVMQLVCSAHAALMPWDLVVNFSMLPFFFPQGACNKT